MKIIQILNNNVALVQKGGNEIIVFSKGIGVKKKKGQMITESDVEKTYILDSHDMLEHFSYLLSHSEPEDIVLINDIIAYGERMEVLDPKACDYLSLTLLDHVEFLLKRCLKGQYIKSPLLWDVKRFYPKHFEVGLYALSLISKAKGIILPDEEAVSIALHFVNLQMNNNSHEDTVRKMTTLSDIISIIELHFHIRLNENSMDYMRLTTHVQYFIQRIMEGDIYSDEDSLNLYEQVILLYPDEFKCVQKIAAYIKSEFGMETTTSERTYLTIHIKRVTLKIEGETI